LQPITSLTGNTLRKANNAKYSRTKLNYTQYTGSVAFYDTQPGNKMDLSTTIPSPHGATTTTKYFKLGMPDISDELHSTTFMKQCYRFVKLSTAVDNNFKILGYESCFFHTRPAEAKATKLNINRH